MSSFKFFLMPYCVPDNYSPECIALAEGLQEMGHDTLANIDYWYQPECQRYLLRANESTDYDVAIYDYKYLYHAKKWTLGRVHPDKINVLIDRNDWLTHAWEDPEILKRFDLILIDHYLAHVNYPHHVKPWAIGLTQRVMTHLDKTLPTDPEQTMQAVMGHNFRVGHNLRKLLIDGLHQCDLSPFRLAHQDLTLNLDDPTVSEVDKHYAQATANRHNPTYYAHLNNTLMTLAFGGYYEYRPFALQPYTLGSKIKRRPYIMLDRLLEKMGKDRSTALFVFQYDSFRLWESLGALTCPILLDFDFWGFVLPQMPREGTHYLGIKHLNLDGFEPKLRQLTENDIRDIGLAGRDWALEHYAPAAVAQRLLNLMDNVKV